MDEKFDFAPTAAEYLDGFRAITRSVSRDANKTWSTLVVCFGVYGLPLLFAWIFFRGSFDDIYFTIFLLIVATMVLPRMFKGPSTAIAERSAVSTEVRLDSDGIRHMTSTSETTWPWASLNRLHVLDKLIVLEFRDWSWIPLPNRLWVDGAARAGFIGQLRSRAEGLVSDSGSDVPSPFTKINVGAGFGAMDIYLWLLTVLGRTARSECGCDVSWHLAGQSVPFWLLNAALIVISFAAFFPIRYALWAVDRRERLAALIIADLLIWPVPIALLIFTVLR